MSNTSVPGVRRGAKNSVLSAIGLGVLVVYALATFLPGFAVTVRRLHDTGRSGW